MRWLVWGEVTSAAAEAMRRHGHVVLRAADAGVPSGSTPLDVLRIAHQKQLDVLTDDALVVDTLFIHRPRFIRTLVYLQLAGGEVEQDDAIDRLFARYRRLSPERVYTVTGTRVKVRQAPPPARSSAPSTG